MKLVYDNIIMGPKRKFINGTIFNTFNLWIDETNKQFIMGGNDEDMLSLVYIYDDYEVYEGFAVYDGDMWHSIIMKKHTLELEHQMIDLYNHLGDWVAVIKTLNI